MERQNDVSYALFSGSQTNLVCVNSGDVGQCGASSDTNAETACGDNEYLRGDGSCQVISSGSDTNVYTAGILRSDSNALLVDLNYAPSTADDFVIKNFGQDKDINLIINDGGTTRTAIQINGDEGSVTMPRQSYVYAYRNSALTVAKTTYTTFIYPSEAADRLGDYNNSTGIFTAKHDGVYHVVSRVQFDTGGYTLWNVINVNGARNHNTYAISYTAYDTLLNSASVYLTSGQTVKIEVYQTSGGNISSWIDAAGSNLTITKVS